MVTNKHKKILIPVIILLSFVAGVALGSTVKLTNDLKQCTLLQSSLGSNSKGVEEAIVSLRPDLVDCSRDQAAFNTFFDKSWYDYFD